MVFNTGRLVAVWMQSRVLRSRANLDDHSSRRSEGDDSGQMALSISLNNITVNVLFGSCGVAANCEGHGRTKR